MILSRTKFIPVWFLCLALLSACNKYEVARHHDDGYEVGNGGSDSHALFHETLDELIHSAAQLAQEDEASFEKRTAKLPLLDGEDEAELRRRMRVLVNEVKNIDPDSIRLRLDPEIRKDTRGVPVDVTYDRHCPFASSHCFSLSTPIWLGYVKAKAKPRRVVAHEVVARILKYYDESYVASRRFLRLTGILGQHSIEASGANIGPREWKFTGVQPSLSASPSCNAFGMEVPRNYEVQNNLALLQRIVMLGHPKGFPSDPIWTKELLAAIEQNKILNSFVRLFPPIVNRLLLLEDDFFGESLPELSPNAAGFTFCVATLK